MNLMRFTIVDAQGSVSFLGDGAALPALVAACSRNPETIEEFLAVTEKYYQPLREYVLNGLAVFDEHNANGNYAAIHSALEYCPPAEMPVFRVVDEATRRASVEPIKAGVIVFNLAGKRIIQIQNAYIEIARIGKGQVYDRTGPTSRTFRYQLRSDWSLVP